jgi:hypothetical protein
MSGQRPLALRQASAYYRLAAKAERAGNYRGAERYRAIADRRVAEHRREVERRAARAAADAAWRAKNVR